jgi:hypothetical protein
MLGLSFDDLLAAETVIAGAAALLVSDKEHQSCSARCAASSRHLRLASERGPVFSLLTPAFFVPAPVCSPGIKTI